MSAPDETMLAKVVRSLKTPRPDALSQGGSSILVASAQSYVARPLDEDETLPTGFDPAAAALFEAVVEAAFLVANADGEFDDDERHAFRSVVIEAVGRKTESRQIDALIEDLGELLLEDGLEARVGRLGKAVSNPMHQREVLRVAALLAQVSGGVSEVERGVLGQLAGSFGLGEGAVGEATNEAERALSA